MCSVGACGVPCGTLLVFPCVATCMPHLRCGDSICSSLTLNILVQLFWEEAEKAKALLSTMPNFEAAVREFIGGVVAQTYQLVEKVMLRKTRS